jgi:crossover junction endodeoxyribonuclease RuvC
MLLALDLGTTTGFAIRDLKSSLVLSGRWEFKNSRYEGGGMRYLRFRRELEKLYGGAPISVVAFEEVRRHAGTDAAHVYGGLLATLTAFCEENSIPYEGIPVGTIKRFWTGKGNASKEQMIEAAVRHGYEPIDDNEADAIAILHLKAKELGL